MPSKRSVKDWQIWERRILADAQLQGYEISRIPEEVRGLYTQRPTKIKSDVDFCMAINGAAVWFDAKACEEILWNIKKRVFRIETDKQSSTLHQWAKLKSAADRGCFAGYLIWFTEARKISWAPVSAIEFAVKNNIASLHWQSEGVTSQDDDKPIDFRSLIFDCRGEFG